MNYNKYQIPNVYFSIRFGQSSFSEYPFLYAYLIKCAF